MRILKSSTGLLILLALSGCISGGDDEETIVAKKAALVVTCAPNLPIYQWSGKLYYRETETFKFREVISKVENVCEKFRANNIAANGSAVSQ